MNEEDLSSLVARLTPRVVESCRQHVQEQRGLPNFFEPSSRPSTSHNTPTTSGLSQPSHPLYGNFHQRPSISPREELRNAFKRRKKGRFTPVERKDLSGHKCMDVVLLPDPKWSQIVRGKTRALLHEDGLLIDKFRFEKCWSEKQVFDKLSQAFQHKLVMEGGDVITFCLKKAEGNSLLRPRLSGNEVLDGEKICDIFKQKTVYLCPDRELDKDHVDEDDSVAEKKADPDSCMDISDSGDEDLFPVSATRDTASIGSNQRACHKCTFINHPSALVCDMCFESLLPPQETPTLLDRYGNHGRTISTARPSPKPVMKEVDEIKSIREIVGFHSNPSQVLYITRDTILEYNVAFFKAKLQIEKPITVKFQGEMAIDAGGPLRENFRILMQKLRSSELNMFFGTHSHNLLPSNNQMLLYSGMFEVLGSIIAAAIVNGVALRLPLHPAVIGFILDRPREEQYSSISLEDVLDVQLQEFLRKILNCETDEEVTQVVTDEQNPAHWLDNCGWPVSQPMTVSCKHDLVLCVMYHYIVGMRSSSISAIQKGMKCKDKFPLKVMSPSQLAKFLSPPPIYKTELKELVSSSLGRLEKEESDHAGYVVRLFDDINDEEANTIAVFATGADSVYKDLEEITLALNSFNTEEDSPIANTCTASVLFPVSFQNYESFKTHNLKMIKKAVDFFGML